MVFKTLILISVLFVGCGNFNPFTSEEPCGCDINIYSNLPTDNDGVYLLEWNENLVMTYSHLFVNTKCGLHTKVSWDSDFQYRIQTDWFSLINPSSMTDENGDGQIVYGVWEEFRGMTITLYGGYYCDLEEQHLDSVKVRILQ